MGLKTLLFAAALTSMQPITEAIASEAKVEENKDEYVELSLIGAYNLQKIALKEWDTEDFKEYVLEDPWPAGFGTNIGGQLKVNDVILRGNWYNFDTKSVFSDLLNLEGGFDKTYEASESIDGVINTIIDGSARIKGRWKADSEADVISFGVALPLDDKGRLKTEATFTLDYFKYYIRGSAKGTIYGNGSIKFVDVQNLQIDLKDNEKFDLRADISGRGLTALIGPKSSYEFSEFEFLPSTVINAITGFSLLPDNKIKSTTVYGSVLLELIIEDQQYNFTIQDKKIELPDEVYISRRNDTVSLGYDFGVLFELYPNYYFNIELHGDSGLTDVLELGIRKKF